MFRLTTRRAAARAVVATACAGALATTMALAGTAGASPAPARKSHAGASGGTITFGQLLPFTGTKAFLSSWATHGDAAAVYDVNHNGGVMGQMLKPVSADDAGDAVDAVPALRKLLISHPAFIVGPYSLTIEAVINDFDPNHVVDFMIGGTTQLDHMTQRYVFRTTASDSAETAAIAYYAVKVRHLKRVAYIFDNTANTQGLVAPLTAAIKKEGGSVVANETIVPDQSSYLTEVTKAFQSNPDVIICAFDQQTATTVFTAARELGHLNLPWIGEDVLGSPGYGKAFGPTANKYLYAVSGGSPGGKAYQHFLSDYQAVWHTRQILSSSYNMYDSVVMAALAMTEAKSTNPTVWVNDVTKISNPPGVQCFTYASCVALIKNGRKINYQGATGPEDFNKYHNTFSGFVVDGFTPANQLTQRAFVSAAQVSSAGPR